MIYQYHYTTWPDHGIPESPTDLLNLQRKLRKKFPFTSESPILVHCRYVVIKRFPIFISMRSRSCLLVYCYVSCFHICFIFACLPVHLIACLLVRLIACLLVCLLLCSLLPYFFHFCLLTYLIIACLSTCLLTFLLAFNLHDVFYSAGVGRTGTFIVIDAMLELVQSQRKIDVFNYLNFIRSQRIHLVQVEVSLTEFFCPLRKFLFLVIIWRNIH